MEIEDLELLRLEIYRNSTLPYRREKLFVKNGLLVMVLILFEIYDDAAIRARFRLSKGTVWDILDIA